MKKLYKYIYLALCYCNIHLINIKASEEKSLYQLTLEMKCVVDLIDGKTNSFQDGSTISFSNRISLSTRATEFNELLLKDNTKINHKAWCNSYGITEGEAASLDKLRRYLKPFLENNDGQTMFNKQEDKGSEINILPVLISVYNSLKEVEGWMTQYSKKENMKSKAWLSYDEEALEKLKKLDFFLDNFVFNRQINTPNIKRSPAEIALAILFAIFIIILYIVFIIYIGDFIDNLFEDKGRRFAYEEEYVV